MIMIKSPDGRKPIFSWCPDADDGTISQMTVISSLPFVDHCALMPDAHVGMMMPIGGVVACDGVVVPNFVGIDIGCGVKALQTCIKEDELSDQGRQDILAELAKSVPVGFAHNDAARIARIMTFDGPVVRYVSGLISNEPRHNPVGDVAASVQSQIGTLGGGNHFLEFQRDEFGRVWIMIHSGSRNIGKKIGDYFNGVASDLNARNFASVPRDIPFLPTDSEEGRSYLEWMRFALEFAKFNRCEIMNDAVRVLETVTGKKYYRLEEQFVDIDIHHNYASLETHFGKEVWVHRKGATLASKDTVGVIPGSMGTRSYIVRGLGNESSLNSCSHGAGRRMGRKEFNRQNNSADGIAAIEKSMAGIVHGGFKNEERRKKNALEMLDVSEAPQAYKDIDEVLANEADLVRVHIKLSPMIVLKG